MNEATNANQNDEDRARIARVGLVLLSGGMDSVALLHQSLNRNDETHALFCGYGQANETVERATSERIAGKLGVPLHVANLGGAVQGVPRVPPSAGTFCGINTANMPARNMIMISAAAAIAGQLWGDPAAYSAGTGRRVTILLGATFSDVKTFPDCRPPFERAASDATKAALSGILHCEVYFPWVRLPKWDLLRLVARAWPHAVNDVRESVSCYSGTRCGQCSACTVRALAFLKAGMDDE